MSLASLRLFQAPSTFFVNQKPIRFKKISMLRSSISRLNKPLPELQLKGPKKTTQTE